MVIWKQKAILRKEVTFMDHLLQGFIGFLKEHRRLSVNTLESYNRDVMQYLDFLKDRGYAKITDTPYDIFQQYIDAQQEAGRAPTTINRSMASVRVFYRFLMSESIVSVNPTIGINSPRIERRKPGTVTEEEINLLLDQPEKIGLKGIRDKGMMELVYASGIRVHELIALNVRDLDLRNRMLRCGEPGYERYIPLEERCIKPMTEYLEMARPFMLRDRNEEALFINTNGGRLSRQGFWKIIKQYSDQAGIDKEITPHMLRQALAIRLLKQGRDPEEVKAILGRTDLTSLSDFIPSSKSR